MPQPSYSVLLAQHLRSLCACVSVCVFFVSGWCHGGWVLYALLSTRVCEEGVVSVIRSCVVYRTFDNSRVRVRAFSYAKRCYTRQHTEVGVWVHMIPIYPHDGTHTHNQRTAYYDATVGLVNNRAHYPT